MSTLFRRAQNTAFAARSAQSVLLLSRACPLNRARAICAFRVSLFSTTKLPRQRRPLNILFFGTDFFAKETLKPLIEAQKDLDPVVGEISVVCPPSQFKKKGLKTKLIWQADTEKLAMKHGLAVHNTSAESLSLWRVPTIEQEGRHKEYDIGIISSFGKFVPASVINKFQLGMINVHPSLLPKYRGPSPIQTTILNGDYNTGVTIQEVHPKIMDGGKILAQVPFTINEQATRLDVMLQLGHLGGELVVKVLKNLDYLRKNSAEQDESQVTQTKMVAKYDAQITWECMTAEHIMRMHRAYYGSEPVYSFLRIKNKMKHVQIVDLDHADPKKPPINEDYLDYPPGTMFFARKIPYIEILCIDGSRLHATKFVVSGKQATDQYQFTAGYLRGKKLTKFPRLLTSGPCLKRPTPPFVFPSEYKSTGVLAAESDKSHTEES
ncbi:Methionyl-tRNA formyltransferase [Coemansia spiralis]|uniref:methionyl-tRNA formyltransferase n=2 Tax=Coemansia TaxID=4863 RepID=A0A9W8G792_9FUNG|nr:formyl transferase [Coemansia spiralis]KAJ1991048.1 Methionyl-tRNA formyltransferase [Coemansia umbellata]KAJ2621139.1 Methionyl-tRNA formyltransferase [Coemansia sp. RSA 1358]KAJ2675706.1 Methionyl-tRNA formyltransferase [Coemansia spiralis]